MKEKHFQKRMIDLVAAVVMIPGLILLFIFPSSCIGNVSKELTSEAENAIDAVFKEDWTTVISALERMQAHFLSKKEILMMFLNHQDISELEASIRGCLQLARAHDNAQILLELESIAVSSQYLDSIEKWSLFTLL